MSGASDSEFIAKSGACIGTSSTANAVPLPLIGEGLSALESGRDLQMSIATLPNSGERSVAGPRVGASGHERRRGEAHRRQGWVSAQIQGADSGFRRTACFHPRRAQRRAQVCGEVTVESVGQGNQQSPAPVLAPHPPLTRSPFPSIGEGLSAVEVEARLAMSAGAATLRSPQLLKTRSNYVIRSLVSGLFLTKTPDNGNQNSFIGRRY